MRKVYYIIFVSLLCPGLFAESPVPSETPTKETYDIIPSFNDLTTEDGTSAISMTCVTIEKNKIFCNGVRMSVDQISPEETQKRLASSKSRMSTLSSEKLEKGKEQFCTHYKEDKQLLADENKKVKNRDFYTERARISQKLCEAKSKPVFTNALDELIRFEGKSCSMNDQLFQLGFLKFSDTTWASTSPPQGQCKVAKMITLEKSPKSDYLWTYREALIAGELNDPKCLEYQKRKPLIYSWDQAHLLGNHCQYLRYGNE